MTYISFIVMTMVFLIGLGTKWEIKLKVVLPWALIMTVMGCVSLNIITRIYPDSSQILQLSIAFSQAFILTAITLLMFFFRDPERTPPTDDGIIVSPADGEIIYIKEIDNGEFPFAVKGNNKIPLKEFTGRDFIKERGIQIGIAMNYLNVHVNRTPIPGEVEYIKEVPGSFVSLKHISALLENERVLTIIKGDDIKVGIVQIASRLVRRILLFVKEGDRIQTGQRIGKITLGSQVDVLIPSRENLKLHVDVTHEVKAGLSIIASYK